MEIISPREVELTAEERRVQAHYEFLLDMNTPVLVAATRIQELFPTLDPAFFRWLRGEELLPARPNRHRTEWHEETWAEVVNVLREHFTENGFEVHVNSGVRTVTIIHRESNKALGVLDATGTHYDGQGRLVWS